MENGGGSKSFFLTEKELRAICEEAADKAVERHIAAREELDRKNARRWQNEKSRVTKKKLAAYRRVKASINETFEFSRDEQIDLRWRFIEDLMGSVEREVTRTEDEIVAIERKRKRDLFEIQSIDRALALYAAEVESNGNDEFRRRYEELRDFYIDEPGKTVVEIAEERRISEKTVYKDINIACDIMAVYLLGM